MEPAAPSSEPLEAALVQRYSHLLQHLPIYKESWQKDVGWLCMLRIACWLEFDNQLQNRILAECGSPRPGARGTRSQRVSSWVVMQRPQKGLWWSVAAEALQVGPPLRSAGASLGRRC
jgi:hypothetical protein